VAEYFRRGIGRTYFYELLDQDTKPADQEANFGLLRHDLSEKPIFSALNTEGNQLYADAVRPHLK
jgi:hypothetical protein